MPQKRTLLHRIGTKLIAAALIIIGAIFLTDLSLQPLVEKVNTYECHNIVSSIINGAVTEELENRKVNYSQLVKLTSNNDGEVVSIESDITNINKLKTNIASRIGRELKRLPLVDFDIPLGTLTGIQLLYGKGFNIDMSLQPMGFAKTKIISEFTEAGINQTRHRILVEVKVNVDTIIPGFTTDVQVVTSIVAAETIIIGRVPDAYTHVVSADQDLVGTLEDYEADF